MLHSKTKTHSGIRGFALGLLFSLSILVLFSFVMALVASFSSDPTAKVGGLSLLALLSAAAVSGVYIAKSRGEGGVKSAALTALTVALIMSILGIILGGGMPLSLVMNCLSYFGVSTLLAFLFGRGGRRKRHR